MSTFIFWLVLTVCILNGAWLAACIWLFIPIAVRLTAAYTIARVLGIRRR